MLNIPRTKDGIQFRDGMEIWFIDHRQVAGQDGWKEQSQFDGLALVNGYLRDDTYSWRIDKHTPHNAGVCASKGGEQISRNLPFVYEGMAIDRLELHFDRDRVARLLKILKARKRAANALVL